MKKKNWVCFYSQTGQEIMKISKELGILPNLLVTNDFNKTSFIVQEWIKENNIIVFEVSKKAKTYKDYESLVLYLDIIQTPLITLHGYLRILPREFCELYDGNIYNGHPALIVDSFYPELKGKDQQETVFIQKEKYPFIGTVIHKVIPELDAGEIILYNNAPNNLTSIEDAYNTLKQMSLELWLKFFQTSGLLTS